MKKEDLITNLKRKYIYKVDSSYKTYFFLEVGLLLMLECLVIANVPHIYGIISVFVLIVLVIGLAALNFYMSVKTIKNIKKYVKDKLKECKWWLN